jgi:hypothetical protein
MDKLLTQRWRYSTLLWSEIAVGAPLFVSGSGNPPSRYATRVFGHRVVRIVADPGCTSELNESACVLITISGKKTLVYTKMCVADLTLISETLVEAKQHAVIKPLDAVQLTLERRST